MKVTTLDRHKTPFQHCSFKKVNNLHFLQEQLLLQNISQGNKYAFWQLWMHYQNYLYRRCLTWMGGNTVDASEALSRAMFKAQEKLPNYASHITNPKAWLTRVTHNLCVDLHREHQRRDRIISSMEAMAQQDFEQAESSDHSPESILLNSELGIQLRRAIDALPPRLYIPFTLRFEQEKSYSEIAQQLNISQNNARKRIQQARNTLKKQLQLYVPELNL